MKSSEPIPTLPQAGLASFAERHRRALWRYLRVLGADASLADDLAQESFVVALRREGFDASDPAAVFVFLRTTARHLWLKSQHRRGDEPAVLEADAVWNDTCGDGDGDGEGYLAALRECMKQLPPRSRELLQATYGEAAGRAATATRFALSADGVKSALRRLRTFLHDCITRRRMEEQR